MWSGTRKLDFAAKPTALQRMPGNLPSERRRSGSSTPGHVRPEGTPPRKSEATQAKTAPARSHSTRGRRQRRSAQCPSRQARPSIPTATGTTRDFRPDNGGNGRPSVYRVAFLFGGGCGSLLPVLLGGGSCSCVLAKQQVVVLRRATAKAKGQPAAHGPEGRRVPAQKLPPASGQRRGK